MLKLRKCNASLGYEAVSFGTQVSTVLSEEGTAALFKMLFPIYQNKWRSPEALQVQMALIWLDFQNKVYVNWMSEHIIRAVNG